MKATILIQARRGSQRLPDKVLLKLKGRTVLEHVIARSQKAKTVDRVIVATTVNDEDQAIVDLVEDEKVDVYRGSQNDVLDRFYRAAKKFKLQHIVRITADCPVIDPTVIDQVVNMYFSKKADYCSNTIEPTFPDGEDVEVFSSQALEKAWKKAKLPSEREHVTPFIWKSTDLFKVISLKNGVDNSDKRWTLDEKDDYEFLKNIYDGLYDLNPLFGMKEIIEYLKTHPDLEKVNKLIGRNEGYLRSLRNEEVEISE